MTITLTLQRMTPDAVPDDAPASRLLAAFQQRGAYALAGRDDVGAGVGGHALTALALLVALTDRLAAQRWPLVECALRAGVDVPTTAAALALDPVELVVGYGHVLDDRIATGKVTPAEGDQLRALLGAAR